ncbi:uncharacterized protein HMPREF1541_07876 [Cyphellophora europaea CBS 101466]|uniref:Uncharacterized protein n=1 Tax=Cyphellophora europaea (strain CBS 101466) TaxID=1220924 RepID=W2RMF4_CYPE1|nr:uncharacterized protein HMPREF1541_07876 [Cyphellophora europaea CBS 101466]ETN36889.1 hypothetical protein HMPREF1541_07876 [Cyphellophora europaea CBS 101466]
MTFASPDPDASPAAGALDAYTANRRTYLFLLRRQTRLLIFLLATLEAVWRGPVEIAFSKNFDPSIDHGFVYTVGYILSYIYTCVFVVVWGALFEWWVPVSSEPSPTLESVSSILNSINMCLIPTAIGITLAMWGMMVAFTLVAKHTTPLVHTSRARQLIAIACTTAWSTAFGYFALEHLSRVGVARVRWEMDAWVLLPIAVNIGIAIGTAMISKLERKRIARAEAHDHDTERAISVQEFLAEEKRPLMDV